jgi:hypothetical protein
MERASLMYAIHMLDADEDKSHVMLFFGGFMLVLALMLAASIYRLWRSLSAMGGRRRTRLESVIKD